MIPNDKDMETAKLADAGTLLDKALHQGTPVHDDPQGWDRLIGVARLAWLTGESMVGAIAEEAVNLDLRITDGQLWALTQEAQLEP